MGPELHRSLREPGEQQGPPVASHQWPPCAVLMPPASPSKAWGSPEQGARRNMGSETIGLNRDRFPKRLVLMDLSGAKYLAQWPKAVAWLSSEAWFEPC